MVGFTLIVSYLHILPIEFEAGPFRFRADPRLTLEAFPIQFTSTLISHLSLGSPFDVHNLLSQHDRNSST